MDRRKLISRIVERTGIKLDPDDPAFLLVELNHLAFEESAGEVAGRIEAAAARFDEITTRNVDNFVSVANEALSKFIQRTNEIKAALDVMEGKTGVAFAQAGAAPQSGSPIPSKTASKRDVEWWLRSLVFGGGGALVGVVAAALVIR